LGPSGEGTFRIPTNWNVLRQRLLRGEVCAGGTLSTLRDSRLTEACGKACLWSIMWSGRRAAFNIKHLARPAESMLLEVAIWGAFPPPLPRLARYLHYALINAEDKLQIIRCGGYEAVDLP